MLKPLILNIIILLLISQCNDNGVKPPDENGLCEITDTTSHAFTWYTDTLGVWPSVLYAVSAVDENNVWAVGNLEFPNDTSYNAAKWNGESFEYHHFKLRAFGTDNLLYQELRTSLTFTPNDIWFFSETGSFIHWNGFTWESHYIGSYLTGVIKAVWGTSSENFFIVGNNGSITHYDGSSFTQMESDTDVDLHAVTGYTDPKSGLTHAWAAGGLTLLYYDGDRWQTVWDEDNPLLPDSYNYAGALYAPTPRQLLIAAYRPFDIRGYCINTSDPVYFKQLFVTDFYPYAMDGTGINDVFVVGSSNSIAHFNGSSIMKYPEANSGSNRSVSYINNNVYIVGPLAEQLGLFVRGSRN